MRTKSAFFTLCRCLLAFGLLLALAPTGAVSAHVVAPAPASSPPAAAASAGCQWTYYPIQANALQPPQALYDDPANTPIADLSVGSLFKAKANQLASRGAADFNGDNVTDIFRTAPKGDGDLQWAYSSGGAGAWQNLAFASPDLAAAALQFGKFNPDAKTDVFASEYGSGAYHWKYSPSGTDSFVALNARQGADRLALGDFNGDGVTDVFTANLQTGSYQWGYFPSGSGALHSLAYADTNPSVLRFGDFNGDGVTDVFGAAQLPNGSTPWEYSSGGAASFTHLITSTVPYSELQFGDFNGDGTTDVLAALPQADGGLRVVYWPAGLGAAVTLGQVAAPAPALRVGDFNGDGVDDLLALRCGMSAPLQFGPLQTLAASGYQSFFHALLGDANGDGSPDVMLVSTCQNPNQFGMCATHHLLVSTALSLPAHGHLLTATQQLGANSADFEYDRTLAGDFDGDGQTDLALVEEDGVTLTIDLARSNGNGLFTLGTPQLFGGEADWGSFNPIVGDFNGDGQDDLALTTVCNTVALQAGSCTNGTLNHVYVAAANGSGGFALGARQDLSASPGWSSFYAFAGDFNGDGRTDLVFNSTCQKNSVIDSSCTAGDANLVYAAPASGQGVFGLGPVQVYGGSGWANYPNSEDLVGDLNGDGRSDLLWSSDYQPAGSTHNHLVVAGLAHADGTFALGSTQNFGSAWGGNASLADLNHDGKADLLWNRAPLNDTDVDTYVLATASGNGAFSAAQPGAVYTGQGYFSRPEADAPGRPPTSLTLISTRQDVLSNALFMVEGAVREVIDLPLLER